MPSPEPERGRTRYRSFEYEKYGAALTPRTVDDPICALRDVSPAESFYRLHGDDAATAADAVAASSPPVEWQHYHYLPPHEPALTDLSWSCSSSERSTSTASSPSIRSPLSQSQSLSSPPPPPPLPHFSIHKREMVRLLVASTTLYIANQTTLVAADALLQHGVGSWGRACIGINTVLCCQTVMLAGWGLERVGRRRDGAAGAADRTWRKRWARVQEGLVWAIAAVAAVTVFGILLLGLGWAASRS
jgi:hypothetical protein